MFSVFTLGDFIRVVLTVLWFVLFRVVKVFDSVVSHVTWVTEWTRGTVCIRNRTHIRAVRRRHSPAIFKLQVVVKKTLFGVVWNFDGAVHRLKRHQIQLNNWGLLRLSLGLSRAKRDLWFHWIIWNPWRFAREGYRWLSAALLWLMNPKGDHLLKVG